MAFNVEKGKYNIIKIIMKRVRKAHDLPLKAEGVSLFP